MSNIKKFFKKIKDLNNSDKIKNSKIMNELKGIITLQIEELFPNLNFEDQEILHSLTLYLHYQIIIKFLDIEIMSYLEQFVQRALYLLLHIDHLFCPLVAFRHREILPFHVLVFCSF